MTGSPQTTGDFSSLQLAKEEEILLLPSLSMADALEIGEIAVALGLARNLPIAIDVRLADWTVFHVSLPGSKPENDSWIARKARVVLATGHSTMFERVKAEEQGIDWYSAYNRPVEEYAIHGGGLPLRVVELGLEGILLISGLPQVQDHLLGVEVLTEFLARKGELQ
ncbi:MAG: heme-binding protein [Actinomycetes bacterium]